MASRAKPKTDYALEVAEVESESTSCEGADRLIRYVRDQGLVTEWLSETHAHADHLTAAQHLKHTIGGTLAIGREITRVQHVFGDVFNAGENFAHDATLGMPKLILPSFQVNIRAGELLEAEDNGIRYLKIPLNQLS